MVSPVLKPFYERDGIIIFCGDCLEVMPGIEPPIDAIIADLPYGTIDCEWDKPIPFEPLWREYRRLIVSNGAIVFFSSQPFTSHLVLSNLDWFRYEIVWYKTVATDFFNAKNKPLKTHENIIVFSPGTVANASPNLMKYNPQFTPTAEKHRKVIRSIPKPTDAIGGRAQRPDYCRLGTLNGDARGLTPQSVLLFSNSTSNRDYSHPTQKPIDLVSYLIRTYTNPGELILDNTMGSGTTLVAAQNEGRRAIGIEISEEYCKIAVDRLRQPSFFSLPTVMNNKPKPEQAAMELK